MDADAENHETVDITRVRSREDLVRGGAEGDRGAASARARRARRREGQENLLKSLDCERVARANVEREGVRCYK